jgi:hypothetical protein
MKPRFFDCCYNNCKCKYCGEKRFTTPSRPRKQFMYMPLTDRLKLQYRNASRARVLSTYRHRFTKEDSSRDVFDGDLYHQFHREELGLFRDRRDVALHMTLDGAQVTNVGHHEATSLTSTSPLKTVTKWRTFSLAPLSPGRASRKTLIRFFNLL